MFSTPDSLTFPTCACCVWGKQQSATEANDGWNFPSSLKFYILWSAGSMHCKLLSQADVERSCYMCMQYFADPLRTCPLCAGAADSDVTILSTSQSRHGEQWGNEPQQESAGQSQGRRLNRVLTWGLLTLGHLYRWVVQNGNNWNHSTTVFHGGVFCSFSYIS